MAEYRYNKTEWSYFPIVTECNLDVDTVYTCSVFPLRDDGEGDSPHEVGEDTTGDT